MYQIIEAEDRFGRHCRVVSGDYVPKKTEMQICYNIEDYSAALLFCKRSNMALSTANHYSIIYKGEGNKTCSQKK